MRSYFVRGAVALALMLPSLANAAQPFDANAFQNTQAAGKTTLIHVGAFWCATCKRQKPIIRQIEQALPELVVYEVDFDTAKEAPKRLGIRHQSTLVVVFKGANEIARSVARHEPLRHTRPGRDRSVTRAAEKLRNATLRISPTLKGDNYGWLQQIA